MGPNGEVTVGDNQGTWVPADYIHYVEAGRVHRVPDLSHHDPPPTSYPPHLCWIPYDVDNSNGAQVWVTSDKWGPLKGQLLYLSYGKCSLFNVLQEHVGDVLQGGVVKFPLKFDSGICARASARSTASSTSPACKGWQTNGAKDGALQRVRYTGKPADHAELHCTSPTKASTSASRTRSDAASAGDVQNYSLQVHNYRWSSDYGSAEYKVSDPTQKGRDPI